MSLKKGAYTRHTLKTEQRKKSNERKETKSSPRPISTAKLNASRHLHTQPINLVVLKGSYLLMQWDI